MSSVYTVYMTYRMKTIYFQVKVHINSQTLNGNSWFSENPSCVQNTDLVYTLRYAGYLQGDRGRTLKLLPFCRNWMGG